ncbi:hypothetical protein H261_11799 [Paramagnetospirillum caucaseum]|uniref:DUF2635 domain-containing protein n=1 Tax=Paramagnetospirillum caucaseum TaxID=1244869 RepID=M2Y9L9_9PROT|nr:DUF2635 domain-containing protein [Paramagnetospirillum caucaseum]EME69716.1 hypothetical protein H261_11799 [Paramagnetospirillum caucaseum]
MKILHLKPAEGLVIRDPATGRPIPAHGASVPASPFWRRLARHGDVVETTAAEIAAGEAPEAAPPEAAPAEATQAETGKAARKAKE